MNRASACGFVHRSRQSQLCFSSLFAFLLTQPPLPLTTVRPQQFLLAPGVLFFLPTPAAPIPTHNTLTHMCSSSLLSCIVVALTYESMSLATCSGASASGSSETARATAGPACASLSAPMPLVFLRMRCSSFVSSSLSLHTGSIAGRECEQRMGSHSEPGTVHGQPCKPMQAQAYCPSMVFATPSPAHSAAPLRTSTRYLP